ncbi:MAG: hypothetical protein C0501_10380 [Isosphaera sp.]|nr:hypothetical protein [Isosphaera sp.]
MKKVRLGSVGVLVLLVGAPGCGPKGDPAVTGAGLTKEEAKARLRVALDLQIIALGLESVADSNGDLYPPADGAEFEQRGIEAPPVGGPKLPPGLSWRAHVLPRVSHDTQPGREREVYFGLCGDKYPPAAGAGWDRPGLKDLPLRPYTCEAPGKAAEPWHTFYRVFVGNGAAFEPGARVAKNDFPDGPDKTILVVEAGEAVPWPKPDELVYDPAKPLPKLGGLFPDGFYAAFADGTVRFVKSGTDEKLIRALITRNGGEAVADLPPKVDTQALRKAAGIKD